MNYYLFFSWELSTSENPERIRKGYVCKDQQGDMWDGEEIELTGFQPL